ncbi:MRS4 [Cyberlindnera jadinii]|uniref:MRS4 protein n=1 Tax=Cyberlindnera jadinii (strain ATCC 18201 / CBS 1600 / BCRC 20928 / JCM 3617 / NBRC 0987 / NRRL Y-1542) TaxID=983966 RepID=A0A0H5CAN6_CYBJN|nr:MRS4 [Cyberlindnera jadinii]
MAVDEIDYEALPDSATLGAQLLAGAFAGIMEHSVMFPIDAIKTRMQAGGLGSAYTGVLSAMTKITTTEGSVALFKGLNSMVMGAGPAHAVYYATYEWVKDSLITDHDKFNILSTALAGSSATIAADALMNPFDTVKQRMQLGNSELSMFKLSKQMYQNEGLACFYYSYPTTVAMNVPFAALNFVIYETSTKLMNPTNDYDPIVHCLCGGISGATAAALTTPMDCIKTVLQVRGVSKDPRLQKVDTLSKAARAIYEIHGWKGFTRGLRPRVIANVPATAIAWTSYEMAKHFLIH